MSVLAVPAAALPERPPPVQSGVADRWQATGWFVIRPGNGIGAAPGAGQIGGSQYGVRVRYALDRRGRLAGFVRAAGPLQGAGAEAALGIEWQPGRLPVRFAIEQRLGLDGGEGGPGIGVVGGVDQVTAREFRLEAYGQAGIIARSRTEPYADGAVRLTRAIATGRVRRLAIGGGVWGAVQRDARRLDIGPTLVLGMPIGKVQARIALDWRQRVAGDSKPGSGIALTLGSDF